MLPGLASLVAAASCNHDPTATKLADLDVSKSVYSRVSGRRIIAVAVTLDATGKVTAASIYQSSGDSGLDAAALDAAKRSTYAPGATNCTPSGGTFAVEFEYTGNGTISPDHDCPRPARALEIAPPDGSVIRGSGITSDTVVAVELTIAADGRLEEAHIVQPSGNMALDQAALAAARQSTYEPKMQAVPIRRQAGAAQSDVDAGTICRAVTGKYFFKVTFRPNR